MKKEERVMLPVKEIHLEVGEILELSPGGEAWSLEIEDTKWIFSPHYPIFITYRPEDLIRYSINPFKYFWRWLFRL